MCLLVYNIMASAAGFLLLTVLRVCVPTESRAAGEVREQWPRLKKTHLVVLVKIKKRHCAFITRFEGVCHALFFLFYLEILSCIPHVPCPSCLFPPSVTSVWLSAPNFP